MPELICCECEHGDKNDGVCFLCFNDSQFKPKKQRLGVITYNDHIKELTDRWLLEIEESP